ncbi:DNA topoisomerase IV subunit A [Mycoplasmopsis canis]|uniref:DNA topoisomerase IV subunit A n=1 Tax=Mycoplasmopsis cynos TaxID=171284 RepID=UPI002AFECB8D|nr:DNA topoisomerase IV subunit A [Mycoplasmopsis cynos]WQQ13083.1 DNA topoisomerase IV subunit A [Mycoplasmopsis cynos]WQQ14187.1 DNA topoisomerase IV subunit A [Mycoplasmopsis cynos]
MSKNIKEQIEKIVNETLENTMSERFEKYAKYVIQQRALPDVRDGLKPVQRRIIYSMFGLGLDYDKPYKKSARVVGDVIGKYHPHGDSSVYEAMVNMSQWWKMNTPLLDMHGNIGSIDDDPAAQMRYTEVRLSKLAHYMIGDIKKKTTLFIPNFDDSEIEPIVLPSLFPNLLVNGAMGIAVGMATNMLPHNLNEIIDATILKVKDPNVSLQKILKIIKGPDFPTGGIIYGNKGIIEGFETGINSSKAKIKLFSKYKISETAQNKFIEITEIPYGVVKSSLVYSIDLLIQNKTVSGLLEVKDQSDRNGINILLTLEKNVNEKSVLTYLFEKTKLQSTYNYNNVVINKGRPRIANLMMLLDAYLTQIKDVKTKTLTFDLEKANLRLEIVIGLLKVTEITDEVIKVIRNAEGSKSGVIDALMKCFNFTLNQATAIAELRLYKLSKTDKLALINEKSELEKLIKRLMLLLSNESEFNEFIIKALIEIKELFGWQRRTQIYEDEFDLSYEETDLIKDESTYLGISRNGFIKRFSERTAESNSMSTYALKDDDNLVYYNKTNTMKTILIFTNLGNYIQLPIYKINEAKWRENGIKLSDISEFKINERVISVIEVSNWSENIFVVLGTKNGYFKKVKLSEFKIQRINKSYNGININSDDEVINVTLSNGLKNIVIITRNGLCSMYSENDIPIYSPKAKGNKGIYLSLNDKVAGYTLVDASDIVNILSSNGKIKQLRASKITPIPKNIKGKKVVDVKNDFEIVDVHINQPGIVLATNGNNQTLIEKISEYTNNEVNSEIIQLDIPQLLNIQFQKNWVENDVEFKNMFSAEVRKQEDEVFALSEITLEESSKKLEELLKKINGEK